MTPTPDQVIANIREALEGSMDKPLNSADRLRVMVDDQSLFTDYISEDAEWAIESLEALLSALKAAEAERDALRKALAPFAMEAEVYDPDDGDDDDIVWTVPIYFKIRDLRRARTLVAGDNHE